MAGFWPTLRALARDTSEPSYGSSGFELWQKFNPAVIGQEAGFGKKYFPGMNAIRLWLSWDSFLRSPKRFARDFDTALAIAAKYGLTVMPVLFNRWHDAVLDYGGNYIDHFLPRASWVQKPRMFDRYMEAVVAGYKDDPRVLAWDLCNEPFSYSCPREQISQIVQAETAWLQGLEHSCPGHGSGAVGPGANHNGPTGEPLGSGRRGAHQSSHGPVALDLTLAGTSQWIDNHETLGFRR